MELTNPKFLLCMLALLLSHSAGAADVTPLNRPPSPALQDFSLQGHVGAGDFSWFGIKLYRASLWTEDGRYGDYRETRPIALTITYEKNISSERLVSRTAREWRRLKNADRAQLEVWSTQIASIWPDVKTGDSLTTLVEPGGATLFYDSNELIGVIDDAEFGPAFLAIWLDEKTRARKLRRQLLSGAASNDDDTRVARNAP